MLCTEYTKCTNVYIIRRERSQARCKLLPLQGFAVPLKVGVGVPGMFRGLRLITNPFSILEKESSPRGMWGGVESEVGRADRVGEWYKSSTYTTMLCAGSWRRPQSEEHTSINWQASVF